MNIKKVFLGLFLSLSIAFIGCAPKDSDIQTDINNKLKDKAELSGVTATVADRIATLSGQVSSEADKNNAAAIAKEVRGVDSIDNNITIEIPQQQAPSASLITDDKMMESAKEIIKPYPDVTASVSGGIITLTGTINKNDEQKLLDSLKTLSPNNINNQLTRK